VSGNDFIIDKEEKVAFYRFILDVSANFRYDLWTFLQ